MNTEMQTAATKPAKADRTSANERTRDYLRMQRALEWLAEHFERQPALAEAAAEVCMSEFHFQRLFTRWAGVSPKRYVQVLTLARAKASLAHSRSVMEAALESGLSGPSRLHDLFVRIDAVTPGEYKRGGRDLDIAYGFHDSPFGEALLMTTDRGLCGLAFTLGKGRRATLADMSRHWPKAQLHEDGRRIESIAGQAFGQTTTDGAALKLWLHGSPFQVKVWQALLDIPPGAIASYNDIATAIDSPAASRAVGTAIGRNPLAWLIPCHRVIRKSGALGGYRWGLGRKLAMLSAESAVEEQAA